MSLVRISKDLMHDVKHQIENIETTVRTTTLIPFHPAIDKVNEDILFELSERILWGEHLHLKSQIPASWLRSVQRVDISIDGTSLPEIQMERHMSCPPGSANYGYVDIKIPKEQVPEPLLSALVDYAQKNTEHREKFEQVSNQVMGFLNCCASLNDALKKFPDISLYVPQSYIDRVNESASKKQKGAEKERPDVALDTDLLTSVGVIGALHGKP